MFDTIDLNGSGRLSLNELKTKLSEIEQTSKNNPPSPLQPRVESGWWCVWCVWRGGLHAPLPRTPATPRRTTLRARPSREREKEGEEEGGRGGCGEVGVREGRRGWSDGHEKDKEEREVAEKEAERGAERGQRVLENLPC